MRLEFIVFVCGAVVMVLEITGSRLIAPYLGTSVYIWTSLIGIILGSLSLGYWWGGRLADRDPNYRTLSAVIFLAACMVTMLVYLHLPLIAFVQRAALDLRLAAVIVSVVLFAPASVLLGIVSPYAVRLKMQSVDQSGSTVGRLYAISTVGSIAGTFLTGFFLFAYLGTLKILLFLAAALLVVSFIAHGGFRTAPHKNLILTLVFFLSLAFGYLSVDKRPGNVDIDTQYSRLRILDLFDSEIKRHVRVLTNEPLYVQGLTLLDDAKNPTKDGPQLYTPAFLYRLVNHFHPAPRRALLLGGGAFSVPPDFLARNPEATMDVVEIDPEVPRIAEKYFGYIPDPRVRVITEDGRTFLNRNSSRYDVIFVDAFGSTLVPPFQLTTREMAERAYESLNDGGVVLVNAISPLEGPAGRLLRSYYHTYRAVFPQVAIIPHEPGNLQRAQNNLIVARKSDAPFEFTSQDPEFAARLAQVWTKELPADVPVLTDDYAPVESYLGIPKV
jgi:spermidine synthase